MKKTVEIYLSNQPSYQAEVDGIEYIVHAGPPPGTKRKNMPTIRIYAEDSARGGEVDDKVGDSKEPANPEIYEPSKTVGIPYADKRVISPDNETRRPPGKSLPRESAEGDSGRGRDSVKETSQWEQEF